MTSLVVDRINRGLLCILGKGKNGMEEKAERAYFIFTFLPRLLLQGHLSTNMALNIIRFSLSIECNLIRVGVPANVTVTINCV